MSALPRWADAELSSQLQSICEEGESDRTEFKERFPEQAHKLARELAALGTSGGGQLIVGINDNCEVVGLRAADGDSRDKLVEQAQGVVQTVRPDLDVELKLATANSRTVLAFLVGQQAEPVFYYEGRPYVRDGRRSRSANPAEVIALIWSHPSSEFKREKERIELLKERDHAETMTAISRRGINQLR